MATMFVRHKVIDFDTWKAAYDAFDRKRIAMGVTGQGVYQLDGDPNDVTVYHHFENMDAAKAFASSIELEDAMEGAGVIGAPDTWFTTRV